MSFGHSAWDSYQPIDDALLGRFNLNQVISSCAST